MRKRISNPKWVLFRKHPRKQAKYGLKAFMTCNLAVFRWETKNGWQNNLSPHVHHAKTFVLKGCLIDITYIVFPFSPDTLYLKAPLVYYPPWVRIGPYIIGASYGYLYNSLNGKLQMKKVRKERLNLKLLVNSKNDWVGVCGNLGAGTVLRVFRKMRRNDFKV